MTFKELAVGQRFKFVDGWEIMEKISTTALNYKSVRAGEIGSSYNHEPVIAVGKPITTTSPTPRTDAVVLHEESDEWIKLCKQLEQELSESLAREQKLRNDLEDIRTILNK